MVKTRTHVLATNCKNTPDDTVYCGGDRERLQIAAAGKYGDYLGRNPFGYTFILETSAELGLNVVAPHRFNSFIRGRVRTP